MKKTLLYLLLILSSTAATAQEESAAPAEKTSKPFPFPVISVAQGLVNYSGDIGYKGINQPLKTRSAYQIELQHHTTNNFSFALFYLNGRMTGEEKNIQRAVNFKTEFMSGGLMFRYDFISRKRSDQILIPFITIGAEYMSFNTYSDLKDGNGITYQYWSDGTIRDIPESDPTADQSILLYRDYSYESDLREANLDGFGKYKNTTWGIPVGVGVRLNLTERFSMHLSTVYHFTGTDYLDGMTSEGTGSRKGNSQKDQFLFSSVSLRFDLFKPHDDVDWKTLLTEDADQDGIIDMKDDSSGTPANNMVDANGKPIDTDDDGIPDYRDKELNSAYDAVVNADGETITEEMIQQQFQRDSLAALPAVIEYLKSYDKLTERKPELEQKFIQDRTPAPNTAESNPIPPLYQELDNDFNGILTPKEIGKAIDDYLAKKSQYSVSEFFDLIDFFFSQK